MLNLAHYTAKQKAQIFYNHIHFANLSVVAREAILTDKRYVKVIRHANFNPRSIELVTANFGSSGVSDEDFHLYALNALDDPRDLWERIFETQLTGAERSLLLVLATARTRVELRDLHRALNAYESVDGGQRTDLHKMRLVIKKLEGTFIQIFAAASLDDQGNGFHPANRSTLIRLANPSFVDYISSYLSTHSDEIRQMARGCLFFEQAETLALWELGEAPSNQVLKVAFDAFFGPSDSGRQTPRLAPGHEGILMDALARSTPVESCTWVNSPRRSDAEVRLPISYRNRHLTMLILDGKRGRTLLGEEFLVNIMSAVIERLAVHSREDLQLEFPLMRYLARYEGVEERIVAVRDLAVVRLMEDIDRPEHFQMALAAFVDLNIKASRSSELSERDLRERFSSFAPEWDLIEAGRVNDVSTCEDSLSLLQDALDDFELNDSIEPVALKDRLSMLQDEVAQDLDFSGDELGEDYGERRLNDADERGVRSDERPDDSIDDLFGTLI